MAHACTILGAFGVGKFNGVIAIYLRLTLVAMVMKISKFEHKVANYTVHMREKSNILHLTGDIQGR